MRQLFLRINNATAIKLFFFLGLVLCIGAIFLLTPELMPSTLLSVLSYFLLSPIVNAMERRGLARSWSIAILFTVAGTVAILTLSWLVPQIAHEIQRVQNDHTLKSFDGSQLIKQYEARIEERIPILTNIDLSNKAGSWLGGSWQKLLGYIPLFASHLLFALILSPFLTFVLINESRSLERALLRLVPNRYFETVYSISSRIMTEMGDYVSARVVESLLIMAMVTIPCLLLGIPYSFLLGIFAAATNPIPYLGPVLGAVPALILAVAAPEIPNQLLIVALIYTVANVVDMVLIFPLVVAKIVNLHPLVVVISVIIGSKIFGILGMILAVPITSILKILLSEVHARIYQNSQPRL